LDSDPAKPEAPPMESGDTGEDTQLEAANWDEKLDPTEAYPIGGGITSTREAIGTPDDQPGEPTAFGVGEKSSMATKGEEMP
jgi:hypothetical protein